MSLAGSGQLDIFPVVKSFFDALKVIGGLVPIVIGRGTVVMAEYGPGCSDP